MLLLDTGFKVGEALSPPSPEAIERAYRHFDRNEPAETPRPKQPTLRNPRGENLD